MIDLDLDLDKLTDIKVDGVDAKDFPDFVDAYISYAYSTELKRELNDSELDYLNEHTTLAQDLAVEEIF